MSQLPSSSAQVRTYQGNQAPTDCVNYQQTCPCVYYLSHVRTSTNQSPSWAADQHASGDQAGRTTKGKSNIPRKGLGAKNGVLMPQQVPHCCVLTTGSALQHCVGQGSAATSIMTPSRLIKQPHNCHTTLHQDVGATHWRNTLAQHNLSTPSV